MTALPDPDRVPGGAPIQILVVEDEDNIALALDVLLTREGYSHVRVASGRAAMDHIRTLRPPLVLLDVMLPGMSGYEICQSVRLDPALSDVRILLMTACGSAIERRKGMALGADGFLAKPFTLPVLRREVQRLLPQHAASTRSPVGVPEG